MKTNTGFTLYPYSLWALFAAVVLLLIFVIITLRKLKDFAILAKTKEQELTVLAGNAKYAMIKAEVINENSIKRRTSIMNKIKWVPTLFAFWLIFGEKDEAKGRKGLLWLTLHRLIGDVLGE